LRYRNRCFNRLFFKKPKKSLNGFRIFKRNDFRDINGNQKSEKETWEVEKEIFQFYLFFGLAPYYLVLILTLWGLLLGKKNKNKV
jgi:hypothetical protein